MTGSAAAPGTPASSPVSSPPTREPRARPLVDVATPPELTTALGEISRRMGELVVEQREERLAKKRDEAKVRITPTRVEIVSHRSPFWGVMAFLALLSLVTILVLMFGIRHKLSTTTAPPSQTARITNTAEDIYATKNEMSALKEKSESNVASLRNELVATTKLGATKDEMAKLENRLESKVGLVKEEVQKQVVAEVKKIVPPNPAKGAVAISIVPRRVNILLVDGSGNVPECFKGVFVSDITQQGKNTHFAYRNERNEVKFVDWNQGVMFSYPYTDNPCITGTIHCTPEIAGTASRAITNVPSYNVYRDEKIGTIRYDNLTGGFPLAIGYVTAQSTLPTQQ